ncbi:MAG: ACT domain-containing protein [Oscillospiraceae bacterium]|nr:ACT domain-containing protein [Oscillospiraceae bacterium]
MRAVITVVGKDTVGIIAEVSQILKTHKINILDITQSILDDLFVMVMLTDISSTTLQLPALTEAMNTLGEQLGLKIHVMHEDVFNSMHRV